MRPSSVVGPRLILAIAIIVVGVVFTLDNLGLVEAGRVLDLWPGLLILAGVARLASGRRKVVGALLVALGTAILAPRLEPRLGDVLAGHWPLLLVAFGLWLAFDAWTPGRGQPGTVGGSVAATRDPAEAGGESRAAAVLSSLKIANDSATFRRGDLVAVMGGCELDLRAARIAPGETAEIEVLAFWGGIEIRVPRDWSVDLRVLPVMGGAEDKTRPPVPPSSQRLLVRGFTIMGGVEVVNGPDRGSGGG